jgi:hypothetical protein
VRFGEAVFKDQIVKYYISNSSELRAALKPKHFLLTLCSLCLCGEIIFCLVVGFEKLADHDQHTKFAQLGPLFRGDAVIVSC